MKIIKQTFLVLFIIAVAWVGYKLDKKQTEIYINQMDDIQKIKLDLDQIKIEQDLMEKQLNQYQEELMSSMGKASWYDYTLEDGWSSKGHRVCATRDFPRGTTIRIINLENGKWVDCLVTDFGPDENVHPDRIVDMSSFAFSKISDLSNGIINVQIKKVK